MKKLVLSIIAATCIFTASSQETTVFRSGDDGYASYRIPAIVQDKKGNLIAFAEGRVDHAGDFGNVDIVYKISQDQGRTWGALQIAVDYDNLQAGNVAPVVDILDPEHPEGRIFLFYNTGNNHEGEVRKGNGLREIWYISSVDGGNSWDDPVNITSQVHRPKQPGEDNSYNFQEDWRTYANTPGHAFQFVSGVNEGRLYIAANHSAGDPHPQGQDWIAHAYYSDDHGKTFQLSENVPYPGTNESSAAQIGENQVYMSSRNQGPDPKLRIISISRDGGHSWASAQPDANLPDPTNQGAVLSWKKGNKFILAHVNAADPAHRDNLTLRLSDNQGKTWYHRKVIAKSPAGYEGDYSAYSDIVLVNKNTVGILYEKDNYKEIVYTTASVN
ncbi:MAG: sialidase family protein [Sphingobacterium sp.]